MHCTTNLLMKFSFIHSFIQQNIPPHFHPLYIDFNFASCMHPLLMDLLPLAPDCILFLARIRYAKAVHAFFTRSSIVYTLEYECILGDDLSNCFSRYRARRIVFSSDMSLMPHWEIALTLWREQSRRNELLDGSFGEKSIHIRVFSIWFIYCDTRCW